jgi:Putative transposase
VRWPCSAPAQQAGHLKFFGVHAHLDDARAFKAYLAPLRKIEWYLYAKPPFGGPQPVLAYLSRYTHRVAISNRRLIASNHKKIKQSFFLNAARAGRRGGGSRLSRGEHAKGGNANARDNRGDFVMACARGQKNTAPMRNNRIAPAAGATKT